MGFVVRARIHVFDYGKRTYLLLCQAEDSEFEAMTPVFQAMTTSLLRGDAAKCSPLVRRHRDPAHGAEAENVPQPDRELLTMNGRRKLAG